MSVITILVGSFACLSIGALLIGIACVKEAFTSSVTRRYEAGNIAVETTTRERRSKRPDRRARVREFRGTPRPDRRRP